MFALPSAEDHDSGIYTIQKYHLVSTSDKFDLKVTNSSIGSVDLQLVLTKTVDRENEEMFQMEVVAVDGGTPPRSGVIQIHVEVSGISHAKTDRPTKTGKGNRRFSV